MILPPNHRMAILVLLSALPLGGPLAAQEEDPALARQQSRQLRARDLTRDLLTSVVDDQLVRLEENGLSDEPIYAELKSMRDRIEAIADEQMPEVVDVLSQAVVAEGEERQALARQAQQHIHQILVNLLAEQERVRMRLRQMQLEEMIADIVEQQSQALDQTKLLTADDEQALVMAVGAQRDVSTLFARLVRMIEVSKQWRGAEAESAHKLAGRLSKKQVTQDLAAAAKALVALEFARAAEHQQRVIQAMTAALAEVRGEADPEQATRSAAERLEEIARDQQRVKDGMASARDSAAADDTYIAEQAKIAHALKRLSRDKAIDAKAARHLAEAQKHADAAKRDIFEGHRAEATKKQAQVLAQLDQAAKAWGGDAAPPGELTNAQEAARRAEALAQTRQKLEAALPPQKQAVMEAQAKPEAAAQHQGKALEAIREAVKSSAMPEDVVRPVQRAEREAKQSADALKRGRDDREAEARDAERALKTAITEVAKAERDAKVEAAALAIGEMNRAAEALDRAAAAARNAAEAPSPPVPDDRAAARARDAQTLGQAKRVAQKVREGVEPMVPAAQEGLSLAADALTRAGEAMGKAQAAEAQKGDAAAAEAQAADARWRDRAQKAAGQMAAAADQTRSEMAKQAQAMAEELADAAERLAALQDAMSEADRSQDMPDADQLSRLAERAAGVSPQAADVLAQAAQSAEAAQAAHQDDPPAAQPSAQTQEQMQRAQALAQMQIDEVAQQQEQAKQMGQAAQAQREAADQIMQAREAPTWPQGAQQMAEAAQAHARALRQAGQAAEDASGQSELGNQPVKEAVQLAAQLPTDAPSAQMADDDQAAKDTPPLFSTAEPAEQASGGGESTRDSASAQAGETGSSGGQELDQDSGQAQHASAARRQTPGQPGSAPATPETGAMVPAAPEQTATMMAGLAGQAAMAQAVSTDPALSGVPGAPTAPGEAATAAPPSGLASSAAPGSSQPGPQAMNPQPPNGLAGPAGQPSQARDADPGTHAGDTDATPLGQGPGTWAASLPPEVRESIRSSQNAAPPRGYEQRLQEYFEGAD